MKNQSPPVSSDNPLTRKQFLGALGMGLLFPWLLPGLGRISKDSTILSLPIRPPINPVLWAWMQAKRTPVFISSNPETAFLIDAVLNQQPVEFKYWGGTEPGQPRRVTPALVFQVENSRRLYLAGYCHRREKERIFQVENMELTGLAGLENMESSGKTG